MSSGCTRRRFFGVAVVLTLAAGAHTAFSLAERYPATAGQRGTIEFAPQPGGFFAVIGLRFNPTGPVTALEIMTP